MPPRQSQFWTSETCVSLYMLSFPYTQFLNKFSLPLTHKHARTPMLSFKRAYSYATAAHHHIMKYKVNSSKWDNSLTEGKGHSSQAEQCWKRPSYHHMRPPGQCLTMVSRYHQGGHGLPALSQKGFFKHPWGAKDAHIAHVINSDDWYQKLSLEKWAYWE